MYKMYHDDNIYIINNMYVYFINIYIYIYLCLNIIISKKLQPRCEERPVCIEHSAMELLYQYE